ncbi:hypothetical protein MRB53_017040 [Persea americana]|uniref:Uncharacterized protein n=1 Tax=Persea americana TaxID=3435 RepID=A0ACC2M3L0_PERAE|nr:hypothetical protein MRB53_017040 [Persea americana]
MATTLNAMQYWMLARHLVHRQARMDKTRSGMTVTTTMISWILTSHQSQPEKALVRLLHFCDKSYVSLHRKEDCAISPEPNREIDCDLSASHLSPLAQRKEKRGATAPFRRGQILLSSNGRRKEERLRHFAEAKSRD